LYDALLNGYEATAIIRDQASAVRNHAIPVIALTAYAFKEDRNKCLAAGMDDYLRKPLDLADLLAILEKWGAFGSAVTPSNPDHTPLQLGKGATDSDIFDMTGFVLRNQGDVKLSRDMATLFINSAQEYIKTIRKALAAGDAMVLYQSAHKLKGAAVNLSLPQLSAITRRIESIVEVGDIEKAGELLPELELRFEQAVEALDEILITPKAQDEQ
jgi:CheY-like chemotaxis protein